MSNFDQETEELASSSNLNASSLNEVIMKVRQFLKTLDQVHH